MKKPIDRQKVFNSFRRVVMLIGCLLDNYEALNRLPVYRQKIKQYGNLFFEEIRDFEDKFLQPITDDPKEFQSAVMQAQELYRIMNKLIDIVHAVNDMQPVHQEAFDRDLNLLLQRYSIRIENGNATTQAA